MEIDKRKIDELITLYELEPNIRDIYVEGSFDKCLIEWFLGKHNQASCAVYEIDTVDISADLLFDEGLVDNNRSRVIFLALYLCRCLPTSKNLTCIADRDFDALLNQGNFECESLLFTDYTSMDIYLINEAILEKFFRLVIRVPELTAKDAINNLSHTLEQLFLIRAANQVLELNMEWLGFERCCKVKAGKIYFQAEDFVQRYLNKNSKLPEKEKFISKINELSINDLSDIRHKIRGKDFIELLCLYIKDHLSKIRQKFSDSEVVRGSLLGCLDADLLSQEYLFQQLLLRVAA